MKKYGLIGNPLGHSFSGSYFSEKFREENRNDCSYTNFELADIRDLGQVLKDPELRGLNVTIPYKQAVIAWLQSQDHVVRETGACNCIRIRNGQLQGFNTDVIGFEQSLKEKWKAGDRKALILGTGGSSRAVAYVLKKMGIDFRFVSRTPDGLAGRLGYEELTEEIIQQHTVIINSTPLGMYPQTSAFPPIPYQYLNASHYLFDLIYNPPCTEFLLRGKAHGARVKNGADMLKIQADASWEIWND